MASEAGTPMVVGAELAAMAAPAKPRRRRRSFREWRKQYKREDVVMGYAFLVVPMVIFLVFYLLAIVFDFGISFTTWHISDSPTWAGLSNYQNAWDPNPYNPFWPAVKNSITFALIVVPCQTVLAFSLATIVNQNIMGRKFFRTTFYFPSVTSSVAITLIFIVIFGDAGVVNFLLAKVGIGPFGFISDPGLVLKSISGLVIWTTSGTYMIIFLAALQDVPRDLYEAAAIDGAGALRTITGITLPLIRPAMFLIVATGLIGAIQMFDQSFIVSGGLGGPDNATLTLVLLIYDKATNSLEYGPAAAIAFLMLVIILSSTLLVRKFIGEESAY